MTLLDALTLVPDPRRRQVCRYPLTGLLSAAATAVMCGARQLAATVRWERGAPPALLGKIVCGAIEAEGKQLHLLSVFRPETGTVAPQRDARQGLRSHPLPGRTGRLPHAMGAVLIERTTTGLGDRKATGMPQGRRLRRTRPFHLSPQRQSTSQSAPTRPQQTGATASRDEESR
ncbi:transposase family protein [Streptomyces sp. YS-3]|uniref:transposase family protein n=1 Tax=Streptomyces sp. YS-3 TaxID=3381352 RepID=UPI003862B275